MLKQANCVKHLTAALGGSLLAPAGQSLLVRSIECEPSAADDYLTVSVDRVTTAFWRVQDRSGNHIGSNVTSPLEMNLMKYLAGKGINVSIPVAEGQELIISRANEVGNVIVVFDRYDAADITANMPNGSNASEYIFMQYMNIVAGIASAGDALFDVSLSPAEFPDFPAGKPVPANHEITLLGLVGYPWLDPSDDTGGFYTKYIKLVKEREVLFDEDRNGLPFQCGIHKGNFVEYNSAFTVIGAGHIVDIARNYAHGEPLLFDPPIIFESGVELNIYANCGENYNLVEGDLVTGTWTSTIPDLACILKVVKK